MVCPSAEVAALALIEKGEGLDLVRAQESVAVRVAFGALRLETQCSWATVSSYTAPELGNQVHCYEGGENCAISNETQHGTHPWDEAATN